MKSRRLGRPEAFLAAIALLFMFLAAAALILTGFATQKLCQAPLSAAPTPPAKNGDTLCRIPPETLEEWLKLPHGSSPWSKRYLVDGVWHDLGGLREALKGRATEDSVCVVLSSENAMPCPKATCLTPVHLRPGTTDVEVAQDLFDKEEYGFLAKYASPAAVLDGGANVGLASIIFATMWPNARIIAVEASSRNYHALQRNVAHYPNVTPLHAGLWGHNANLQLDIGNRTDTEGEEWQYVVKEVSDLARKRKGDTSVFSAVTVDFVLELFSLAKFDVVKIDVEGAEKEIFTKTSVNDLKWVKTASVIAIELHEDIKTGAHDAVFSGIQAATEGEVDVSKGGEYIVFETRLAGKGAGL